MDRELQKQRIMYLLEFGGTHPETDLASRRLVMWVCGAQMALSFLTLMAVCYLR